MEVCGEDKITESLKKLASSVLTEVISANSSGHGGHAEWMGRPPQDHLGCAIGHANAAQRQLHGYKGLIDREDAVAHMKRAIVRSLMAYHRHLSLKGDWYVG